MGIIKHSQITQGNKFAISLQNLKKEVMNGGHFWHADKRQVGIILFDESGEACSKYPKEEVVNIFAIC